MLVLCEVIYLDVVVLICKFKSIVEEVLQVNIYGIEIGQSGGVVGNIQ